MTSQPGPLKSSCNAGEFAPDLYGKVNLKQYYSAAMQMKNIEPVPQSGFRLLPGTKLVGGGRSAQVKHGTLNVSPSLSYTMIFSPGFLDIYRNDGSLAATLNVPAVTADNIDELAFYGEANTFGVFHQDIQTLRAFRNEADDTDWTLDLWPYDKLPDVDLGGTYPETDDVWDVAIRWADQATSIVMNMQIDGEQTKAVELEVGGLTVDPDAANAQEWDDLAARLQTEIRQLPSMTNGVSIVYDGTQDSSRYRVLKLTFSGDLSGAEYQVDSQIVNTADASVLSYHREVGKTDGEPLVSAGKGWFAGMDLFQDRAIYYAPKARGAAVAMSRTGEYFDLNIEASGDAAARLEALRTTTSERIRAIYENTYLLAFTDKGEWFASNRTIKKEEPVNWVRASKNGIQPNVPVAEMGDRVYYISGNVDGGETVNQDLGQALFSTAYDDVSTKFTSEPESLLAPHLVEDINGLALQNKLRKQDAARLWMRDKRGRLICAVVIRNQEIMAFCEWRAADGGKVLGLSVDGQNQVWLTVQRGQTVTHEICQEQEVNLFQGAVSGQTDLAGRFGGLNMWEGREVWARADGYILGPYTVTAGTIDLENPYGEVIAGLWQAPVHESLPYYKVLPNDEVLHRPGRIHSVKIHVIDSESIAVGANGGTPKNRTLISAKDPLGTPVPPKTQQVHVTAMQGVVEATTLVITQTRPGMLRVRDYIPEAKL